MKQDDYDRLRHLLYHACEGGLGRSDEYGELVDLVKNLRQDELDARRKAQAAKKTAASRAALVDLLGQRLAAHAVCDEHRRPFAGCPFCSDLVAYEAYLEAGGTDYRIRPMGLVVPVEEVAGGELVT